MLPKVVFDTNIYISAIIFGGSPKLCLEMARTGKMRLFVSKDILIELATKLRVKFNWSDEEVRDVLIGISHFTTVVTPKEKITFIKDYPTDNIILEVAREAKVAFIISGDKKHLLSLKEYENIQIISAADFLKQT